MHFHCLLFFHVTNRGSETDRQHELLTDIVVHVLQRTNSNEIDSYWELETVYERYMEID